MRIVNQDLNRPRQPNVLPFSASWRCYPGNLSLQPRRQGPGDRAKRTTHRIKGRIMKSITTLLAMALLVAACSPEAKEAKQEVAAPVNCATAKGDIHMLNSVKATVGKEMLEGVTAFIPAGFVIGAVTDTEGDKL